MATGPVGQASKCTNLLGIYFEMSLVQRYCLTKAGRCKMPILNQRGSKNQYASLANEAPRGPKSPLRMIEP